MATSDIYKKILCVAQFVFVCSTQVLSMSMYAFDVGRGNFVVFKHQQNALVVDCGCSSFYSSVTDVKNIFADIEKVRIIITHSHDDHLGMVETLFSHLSENYVCKRADVDCAALVSSNNNISFANIKTCSVVNKLVDDDVQDVVQIYCQNALFDNISNGEVKIYLVDSGFKYCKGPHDYCFVVKVIYNTQYGRQGVLLPGDANGYLLNNLIMMYNDVFDDVAFAIWSHHGSIDNGEDCLIPYYAKNHICSIISSCCTEVNQLPKDNICSLLDKYIKSPYSICETHQILCKAVDTKENVIFNTDAPVFITSMLRTYPTYTGGYILVEINDCYNALFYKGIQNVSPSYIELTRCIDYKQPITGFGMNMLRCTIASYILQELINERIKMFINMCMQNNDMQIAIDVFSCYELFKPFSSDIISLENMNALREYSFNSVPLFDYLVRSRIVENINNEQNSCCNVM